MKFTGSDKAEATLTLILLFSRKLFMILANSGSMPLSKHDETSEEKLDLSNALERSKDATCVTAFSSTLSVTIRRYWRRLVIGLAPFLVACCEEDTNPFLFSWATHLSRTIDSKSFHVV